MNTYIYICTRNHIHVYVCTSMYVFLILCLLFEIRSTNLTEDKQNVQRGNCVVVILRTFTTYVV